MCSGLGGQTFSYISETQQPSSEAQCQAETKIQGQFYVDFGAKVLAGNLKFNFYRKIKESKFLAGKMLLEMFVGSFQLL